jgi:hypothetical protein
MQKVIHFTIVLLFVSSSVFSASGDVQLLKQARSQIKVIAGELQMRVARDIQEKGAENVLDSCRLQVTGITDRLSVHSGWEIRRTSFKVRNPHNVPDPWEEDVLRLFEQRLAEGVAPETFEFAKVVNLDGKRVFRYMKPIIMQDFCTTCHGSELSPELADKITRRYPQDQAVGFKLGELRGAFSMLKVLPGDPP